MLRNKPRTDVKTRRIVATGGAVGFSLVGLLLGLSLVVLSLRKMRFRVDLKRME